VLDTDGKKIGEHHGAALVTVGQRHGFNIFGEDAHMPHYVIATDTARNEIIVSADRSDAAISFVLLRDVSWTDAPLSHGAEIGVQARYREKTVAATFEQNGNQIGIRFFEPHIAPRGQSLVMYRDKVCIGGGVIEKTR
jgi:tRNA-specific 2-thiouridylase